MDVWKPPKTEKYSVFIMVLILISQTVATIFITLCIHSSVWNITCFKPIIMQIPRPCLTLPGDNETLFGLNNHLGAIYTMNEYHRFLYSKELYFLSSESNEKWQTSIWRTILASLQMNSGASMPFPGVYVDRWK